MNRPHPVSVPADPALATLAALRITATAVLLAAALLLAGCGGPEAEEKKEEAALPVEVAEVATGPIEAAYRGTATLEAEDEATVNAKTGGVIEQILVEEGTRVSNGQVLARLETDRLRLEAARAKAEADKARENFERNTRIYEQKLISKELYDQSRFTLDAAQAAYDLAQLALHESAIRAPFSGVVSARHIKVGNLIQPNQPAFRITRLDPLHAHLFVPERDIHKLAPGQPAQVTLDAWPGRRFTGKVLRINPVVDAGSGTVKVTVEMAADQPELKPGMFGRVEVLYDRRDEAVLVAKDAVLTEDAAQSVFVVADGRALRRPVKLGYSDARYYEVIEGLKPGEQVVTTGQAALKDDTKVDVVNLPAVADAGAAEPEAGAGDADEGAAGADGEAPASP